MLLGHHMKPHMAKPSNADICHWCGWLQQLESTIRLLSGTDKEEASTNSRLTRALVLTDTVTRSGLPPRALGEATANGVFPNMQSTCPANPQSTRNRFFSFRISRSPYRKQESILISSHFIQHFAGRPPPRRSYHMLLGYIPRRLLLLSPKLFRTHPLLLCFLPFIFRKKASHDRVSKYYQDSRRPIRQFLSQCFRKHNTRYACPLYLPEVWLTNVRA
jgi:hypothetical protein